MNSQQSSAISLRNGCWSQGATITEKYFLYTDWCGNSKITIVNRCNRIGTSIVASTCKEIIKKNLGHANVLEHTWGSNYFWVFDEGNARNNTNVIKGCYDLDGHQVSNSKCGVIPDNSASYVNITRQGYTQYGEYFLKGASPKNGSGTNRIYIVDKNNNIKTISVGGNDELEDVMVDGNTGDVYFTTSRNGSVSLHRANYNLGKIATISTSDNGSTPTDNDSSKGNSASDKPANGTDSKPADGNDSTPANNSGLVVDPTKNQKSEDRTVDTTLFGKIKDDGKGCGVYMVLNLVIDILTGVIGLAAVIGIAIAGITYQSAKGNEAQTTKAKRRIYEIVIGLAAYAVLYAALNWLLPGGKINTSTKCKTACTTQIVEEKLAVSKQPKM